jgi:hypothetical protein
MRVVPAKRSVAIALLVVVLAIGSGVASAFFSTKGAGSAAAAVRTLSAPTLSTPTPGGGTVSLTWSAVSPPGTGSVTYYVTRDGGEPEGSCPTSEAPTSVLTCVDSGVEVGTHTFKVTAEWSSWTAKSAAKTATVTSGAATHFTLVAASTTPTVAVADNLTITALDAEERTVTSYTGSHSITFTGAQKSPGGTAPTVANSSGGATAFGSATALNFNSGVATVTSTKNGVMKLYRAGPTNITATDGSISNPDPLEVTVAAGVATKLSLAAAATTAGAADNLTTTAQDAYGNTATSYTGSHNVTFSGPANSPNGTVPTVTTGSGAATAFGTATALNFSEGVAAVSGSSNGVMRLYKVASTSITASDGSISASALVVVVTAATAAKFVLTASSLTPAAAANDNLTTTAQDAYGNTATSYTGSHAITFSGAEKSPGGTAPTVANSSGGATAFGSATALNFNSGVAAVSSSSNGVMKLYDAGGTSISAGDGTISTATPLAVTVAATTATRLAFSDVDLSQGVASEPCLFTCTVTGLGNSGTIKAGISVTDAYGNTVSGVGTGHTVAVTTSAGTISGGSLTIGSTGLAESTTEFTFTAQSSGAFTDKITAAKSAGTSYTSATLEASK